MCHDIIPGNLNVESLHIVVSSKLMILLVNLHRLALDSTLDGIERDIEGLLDFIEEDIDTGMDSGLYIMGVEWIHIR